MKIPFSREGFPYVGGLVGLAVLTYFVNLWVAVVLMGMAAVMLWIFRDPEREEIASAQDLAAPGARESLAHAQGELSSSAPKSLVPAPMVLKPSMVASPESAQAEMLTSTTESLVALQSELLAPADGLITSIVEFLEEEFIAGPAIKICIQTSVFDVHVTRVPVSGQVTFQQYYPGKLWIGSNERLHEGREYTATGIDSGFGKVLLRQVRRFFPGRTVVWLAIGDCVRKGARSGIGQFGAVTEIILPAQGVKIIVKPGDRVLGGQTVLGRLG